MQVYAEDRVVVVDKPCGITSEEVAAQAGKKLVHRIDKATSGLLMLADDARAVQRMQRLLARGEVERRYLFLAHGDVAAGDIESSLVRDRGDGKRGSGPGGKLARTHIEIIARGDDVTLGEATLVTGRTHQIRIHLSEAGHPLVGERVYAVFDGSARLMLHARALRFFHPMAKHEVIVESAPPEDWRRICGNLGAPAA